MNRGRPKDPNALQLVSIRLHPTNHVAYLELWRPGGEIGDQVRDVIEFAQKFRPEGPEAFGHRPDPTKPPRPRLTPRVSRYAREHGISKAEAMNLAWTAFEEQQKRNTDQAAIEALRLEEK